MPLTRLRRCAACPSSGRHIAAASLYHEPDDRRRHRAVTDRRRMVRSHFDPGLVIFDFMAASALDLHVARKASSRDG